MIMDFNNGMKRTVLIVDDESDLLMTINDYFGKFSDHFSIRTASNGIEALDVLQEENVSLLVTDIMMPELNGLELLARVYNEYPTVPCIVFSAFGDDDLDKRLKKLGCLHFFDKPFDLELLYQKIRTVLEQSESTGYINALSLESFLQLISLEQKTAIVEIVYKPTGEKGHFFLSSGNLIDATFRDYQGEEAFFKILGLKKSEIAISIHFRSLNRPQKVQQSITHLLMEAARLNDERERNKNGTLAEADNFVPDEFNNQQYEDDFELTLDSDFEEELPKETASSDTFPQDEVDHSKQISTIGIEGTRVGKTESPVSVISFSGNPVTITPRNTSAVNKGEPKEEQSKRDGELLKEIFPKGMLSSLSSIPEVLLTIVFDTNGRMLFIKGQKKKTNMDELGQVSLQIVEGVKKIARQFLLKQCVITTIEYRNQIIVSKPFNGAVLILLVKEHEALGRIRFNLQKYYTSRK